MPASATGWARVTGFVQGASPRNAHWRMLAHCTARKFKKRSIAWQRKARKSRATNYRAVRRQRDAACSVPPDSVDGRRKAAGAIFADNGAGKPMLPKKLTLGGKRPSASLANAHPAGASGSVVDAVPGAPEKPHLGPLGAALRPRSAAQASCACASIRPRRRPAGLLRNARRGVETDRLSLPDAECSILRIPFHLPFCKITGPYRSTYSARVRPFERAVAACSRKPSPLSPCRSPRPDWRTIPPACFQAALTSSEPSQRWDRISRNRGQSSVPLF